MIVNSSNWLRNVLGTQWFAWPKPNKLVVDGEYLGHTYQFSIERLGSFYIRFFNEEPIELPELTPEAVNVEIARRFK